MVISDFPELEAVFLEEEFDEDLAEDVHGVGGHRVLWAMFEQKVSEEPSETRFSEHGRLIVSLDKLDRLRVKVRGHVFLI